MDSDDQRPAELASMIQFVQGRTNTLPGGLRSGTTTGTGHRQRLTSVRALAKSRRRPSVNEVFAGPRVLTSHAEDIANLPLAVPTDELKSHERPLDVSAPLGFLHDRALSARADRAMAIAASRS